MVACLNYPPRGGRMHVLIDAVFAHMGGAFIYLLNVVRTLASTSDENHYTVYVPQATRKEIEAHTTRRKYVTLVDYPYANTGGLARTYFDQVVIPRLIRKEKMNVLFTSSGFGSYWSL